jgi:hypothetical protein
MLRSHYTAAERATIEALYPTALRVDILTALPGRTWNAIGIMAAKMDVRRVPAWTEYHTAMLQEHYPLKGGQFVAELLGIEHYDVTRHAHRLQIKRTWAPKKAPVVRVPRPVAVKPVKVCKPLPMKPAPMKTPNLNKQKALVAVRNAPKPVAITAETVKRLPYSHPGRLAYMLNGAKGWQEWQRTQA